MSADALDVGRALDVLHVRHECLTLHRMHTETLSLRISAAENRALDQRARNEGVSKASVVRRALRAYGVTSEPEPQKSGYDVIKNLVGKSRGGSKDLSTNPKHLADYGR